MENPVDDVMVRAWSVWFESSGVHMYQVQGFPRRTVGSFNVADWSVLYEPFMVGFYLVTYLSQTKVWAQ